MSVAIPITSTLSHTGRTQHLIDSGADAKRRNTSAHTPLHSALHGNRQQVARDLIKAGGDPADLESEVLPRSLSSYSPRATYSGSGYDYSPSRTLSGASAYASASPRQSLSLNPTLSSSFAVPPTTSYGGVSPRPLPTSSHEVTGGAYLDPGGAPAVRSRANRSMLTPLDPDSFRGCGRQVPE